MDATANDILLFVSGTAFGAWLCGLIISICAQAKAKPQPLGASPADLDDDWLLGSDQFGSAPLIEAEAVVDQDAVDVGEACEPADAWKRGVRPDGTRVGEE